MERKRESVILSYPHDLYRRFKEDEYLPLDEKVVKINTACEDRYILSRKGLYDQKEKDGNIVEKLMLEHNSELEKLHQKGNAFMTNVRIACEQRQLEQRKIEKTYEEGILEQMSQKYVEIEGKIVKIYERWEKLKSRQKDEPSKFLKTLKILKNQIREVENSKDDIIQTVKKDLTRINASHHSVLEKQDYDLHYLMQRVMNYLNNLKQCYVRQILKLDETINKFHQDEYDRLYKCRHEFSTEIIVDNGISNMLENIDKKYEAEREFRASLRNKFRELRTEYDEVTHAFRMHMEQDQENMEIELEEKTATFFMNSLKFNYNYQVLEKKDSDNVNQLVYEDKKKNWLKLVELAANLRKQIKEAKNEFETKSFEIADHSEKIRDRLTKLEVKAKNAIRDNESKFQNILKMNLEEANNLLSQICVFNKIFFEEHLGIRWEPPNLQILDDSNLQSLQLKKNSVPEILSIDNENHENDQKNVDEKVNRKMLQSVFETISSSMGYLIDKDLPKIMELCEMAAEDKKLAKLDNALGFEHSESLTKLFENLRLFAYCSHCEDEKVIEIHSNEGNDQTISRGSLSNELADNSLFVPNIENIDNLSIDLDLMRCIEDLNRISNQNNFDRREFDQIHQLNVNYAHILSALEMTIKSMEMEKFNETENKEKKKTVSNLSIDLEQRKNQIELLWNNYRKIFPEEHVHLWSSLEHGLADYLVHLKKRHKLHMECDGLRLQNAQLKYMLQELL